MVKGSFCAFLVVAGLAGVAAPLPDPGLATPTRVVMAAPAALPDVPEPAAQPAAQTVQPAGQPSQAVTIPVRIPAPAAHPRAPQVAFVGWATRISRATGISQRALEAYANAHAVMAATHPSCNIN